MAAYSPSERALLQAVADLVSADRKMRVGLGARMQLNLHDLQALRHVIAANRDGGSVTPRALADEPGISTASTTVLIDRLVAQDHLRRAPHPSAGRSKVLVATPAALREVHAHLGQMHEQMRAVAAAVPDDARPALLDYLRALTELMRQQVDPTGP